MFMWDVTSASWLALVNKGQRILDERRKTEAKMTTLKGRVREWKHSPSEGCWVEVLVGGAVIKMNATPELVAAMRANATIKVTFEVEQSKPCPCCGPLP